MQFFYKRKNISIPVACLICISLFSLRIKIHSDNKDTNITPKDNPAVFKPQTIRDTLDRKELEWLANHPVISVSQDPGWPPVEFADENGEPTGMSSDYLNIIEKRLGIKFKRIKYLTWQESYAKLKNWEIDMTPSVTVTPPRKTFWAFTKPYITIPIVILTRSDITYIPDMNHLKGKRVGVVEGYAVNEWIPVDYPQIQLVQVKSAEDGMRKVQNREIFAFVDNMLVISFYLSKRKEINLKIAGETPYVNAQSIAVRKDWAIFAEILQKTLNSISKEEHANIYRKWAPVRYEHGFNYKLLWQITTGFSVIVLFLIIWNYKISKAVRTRKIAEAALSVSEERLRQVLEGASDGIWDWNYSTGEAYFSPRFYTMLDYEPDEFPASHENWFGLIHNEDREKAELILKNSAETSSAFSFELRLKTKLNDWRWVLCRGKTMKKNMSDNSVRVLGSNVDITERKEAEKQRVNLEERLNRAEKMEALGTLAGGVAHDLNNVLGILVGYSELLLEDMETSDLMRPHITEIFNASERAAVIVQDLLTLARRGVLTKKIVDLNSIILECLKSPEFIKLKSLYPSVSFMENLDADLLNIAGSPVHLNKTIINLLINAAEAIKDQGSISIISSNQYLEKPIRGYDAVREGDYVVLTVSDTGEGISQDEINRIFEPFYTKKVMGRSGTGLGLAVVWGTVKDHNGYIDIESEIGKGTKITLYFPVSREDIIIDSIVIPRNEYMGKGESILIVDDVKSQRELAAMMLKRLNYHVESVASGEEALSYLKSKKTDLVVLDMIMDPGIDGLDTYIAILEINPGQKAIIVSGFSETDRVRKAQELGAGAYVKKPYLFEKLGLAVKQELEKDNDSKTN